MDEADKLLTPEFVPLNRPLACLHAGIATSFVSRPLSLARLLLSATVGAADAYEINSWEELTLKGVT